MPTTYSEKLGAGNLRSTGGSFSWPQSVASGANYLSPEVDNGTNQDDYADVELVWSFGTAPLAGGSLAVHFLYAADGADFEEGDVAVPPLPGHEVLFVQPPADTATHRFLQIDVPLGPYKFKILVVNGTTQTVSVTVNAYTRQPTIVG